ncbi:MAG: TolC family protein [Pirellulaceae bacterium]
MLAVFQKDLLVFWGGMVFTAILCGNCHAQWEIRPLPARYSTGPHAARTTDSSKFLGKPTESNDFVPQVQTLTIPSHDLLSWWIQPTSQSLNMGADTIPVDVATLMSLAAQYSGRVEAVRQQVWIAGTQVDQARAAFDPALFTNSKFDSKNDPVGNTLTTGGPPRLEQDTWSLETGLRGQSSLGTSYKLSQDLGLGNSNSVFFAPNNQGTSRLAARLEQPLLQGRRIDVNRSLILTAQLETGASEASYLITVQKQLSDVASAYWQLYVERANLLQRQRHLERASKIADDLEARSQFDSVKSQILRARAALATRKAELSLSVAKIKNIESRIRALLNAPGISDRVGSEIVTVQPLALEYIHFDPNAELAVALDRRPEIQELQRKIDAIDVRLQLAADQTRPQMNLLMEGYVAGLQGESDVFGAWNNQFIDGQPGYAGGLEMEMPYRNRAARARVNQRRYEIAQYENLLRETKANIQAEVEVAIRNSEAAYQAILSRQASLEAVVAEVAYTEDRWRALTGDARLGQLQLDDLLNAQARLLQEEQALLVSMVEYNLALIEIQRATGAFVQLSE